MAELVYLNGNLVPQDEAKVSPLDYGFLYGYGLFETMRAYEGQVFRLERHLSRLARSAQTLGMEVDTNTLKTGVRDILRANNLNNARIRIAVSAGEGQMPPNPTTCRESTILILAQEYHPYPDETYRRGFRAIVSTIQRNSQSPLSRLKSANFLESILARQEARVADVDEALLLNERGFIAEASMSNLFLVRNGKLWTPPVESGVLPGITREAVMELAVQEDIIVCERNVGLDELFQAKEAFLTNSLMEVMPLTKVEGRPVGPGEPGAVTQRLIAAYRKLVLIEVALL